MPLIEDSAPFRDRETVCETNCCVLQGHTPALVDTSNEDLPPTLFSWNDTFAESLKDAPRR